MFFIISFAGCSQTNKLNNWVKNEPVVTYYYRIPGAIATDQFGNELPPRIDTVYTVYIEVKQGDITWEMGSIKGQDFYLYAYPVHDNRTVLKLFNMEETVELKATGENFLWEIQLSLSPEHPGVYNEAASSWIEFSVGRKKFRQEIKKFIHIEGIPSV